MFMKNFPSLLFVGYITTLSSSSPCSVGDKINDELEIIWKEVIYPSRGTITVFSWRD
jgi:hypothetical protein